MADQTVKELLDTIGAYFASATLPRAGGQKQRFQAAADAIRDLRVIEPNQNGWRNRLIRERLEQQQSETKKWKRAAIVQSLSIEVYEDCLEFFGALPVAKEEIMRYLTELRGPDMTSVEDLVDPGQEQQIIEAGDIAAAASAPNDPGNPSAATTTGTRKKLTPKRQSAKKAAPKKKVAPSQKAKKRLREDEEEDDAADNKKVGEHEETSRKRKKKTEVAQPPPKRKGGRVKGSKVVNGKVIPPTT